MILFDSLCMAEAVLPGCFENVIDSFVEQNSMQFICEKLKSYSKTPLSLSPIQF